MNERPESELDTVKDLEPIGGCIGYGSKELPPVDLRALADELANNRGGIDHELTVKRFEAILRKHLQSDCKPVEGAE